MQLIPITSRWLLPLIFLVSLPYSLTVLALPAPNSTSQAISDQQLIYQQERQKALQDALTSDAPDIRLLPGVRKTGIINFPDEPLCFNINQVELLERDKLPWTLPLNKLANQANGHCLGAEGINLLMSELQNRLVGDGFITTRVVAPEQDLTSGTLYLLLVTGKVRNIYYTDNSDRYAQLYTAMPAREGELLNLRDIEQGLENLQRVPTVSAQMQLIPGEQPGESDVVINREQSKYWRVGLSVDDSGTRTTGRYQGGLTLYVDNPFSLSDSFYVSGGHDLNGQGEYGSNNYLFSYSVPFGYWLLNASLSGNKYEQTVAGINENYKYSGRSRYANLQVSRVMHRNESQKTTLSYGLILRESRNYINDTEIDIQRRQTTSWRLGIQHRHYINDMTLDIGASYQKGVRWFGARKAPEETNPEENRSALGDIFNINVSLAVPFTLGEQRFRYHFDYQGQYTRNSELTPQDQFSIGGRWSVRGFDGELTLSADRGWFIRNELSFAAPYNHELYLGLDTGMVAGAGSQYLLGKRLTGSAIGLRGNNYGIYYDLFAGVPLHKPDGFKTDHVTLGFYLNWNF